MTFLDALASKATDDMEMLRTLERCWIAARARDPAQRGTSRAALAVDVMAAAPLISATTLARAIGMSIKCTSALLDRFVATEIAVEVAHRSVRRLFGLAEMVAGAGGNMRAAAADSRARTAPVRGPPKGAGRATAPLPPMSRFDLRPFLETARAPGRPTRSVQP
jgi:hypothetical protein